MKFTSTCAALLALGAMFPMFAHAADSLLSSEPSGKALTEKASSTSSPSTGQDAAVRTREQKEVVSLYQPRVHLRLGAVVSPQFNFVGGLDFAVPGVRLSRDFAGRIDVEALVVNFKDKPLLLGSGSGTSVYVPFTFNQVYIKGLQSGGKIYGGFGIGLVADFNIFVESPSPLTGKVFLGTQFNSRSSAELGVNFIGSDTFATLQVRFGL